MSRGGLGARLEATLAREWQRRGALAWALTPLAAVFGGIAALRRLAFAAGWKPIVDTGLPVVVVGNVTVGGTGKTPTVIALVEALRANGFHPGVVSRGYGAEIREPTEVAPDSPASRAGDEPLLIARRTQAPVVVCPDRVAAIRALAAAHPELDVVVSDDGLQHYRMARRVELVVFDHRLGGNGFLLPAGPCASRCRVRATPPWSTIPTAARCRPGRTPTRCGSRPATPGISTSRRDAARWPSSPASGCWPRPASARPSASSRPCARRAWPLPRGPCPTITPTPRTPSRTTMST